MAKLPSKYRIKGFKTKYYKSTRGWQKAIKVCQDAEHKGWLWEVTRLFRARVCKRCKTISVVMSTS